MEEERGWWEESVSDVVEPKPIQHISADPASVRIKAQEDDEDKWKIRDIRAIVVLLIIVAIDWIFLDGTLTWMFLL